MTVRYKTRGFVFKKENRMDADRMFSVFTEDFGRLEIFAKAIRKIDSKLRGGIDTFYFSQIEFIQGKNKKTLTDALLLESCGAVTQHPEKFEVARNISDILDAFLRGQEMDGKMWDCIKDTFTKLGLQKTNHKFLYYYFFWNFVSLLGYGPELSQCAGCRGVLSPKNLYFSNKEGGVVCGSCAQKQEGCNAIDASAVKMLRLVLKKDFEMLSKLKVDLASKKVFKQISDGYLQYLLHSHSSVPSYEHF